MQRTEVYIATCALNVGHIKRLKCFINQNLTSHFMSNWMKWHVFGNDERKTWDDAPRQHVSKLDFAFWIDNIRDHDLVIFLEAESNCCFCKIDCCVKIFDSEKGPWVTENVRHHLLKKSRRKEDSQWKGSYGYTNLCGNHVGGSKNSCTREEVRFKTFFLLNTVLRPTEISQFQSIVEEIGRQRQS